MLLLSPHTLTAFLPLNTSLPPPNQLPTCVSTHTHPNWTGPIDPLGCHDAYQLIYHRVRQNLHNPYTFFSTRAFPNRGQRPPHGWPLPQGSSSGTCALIIRMAHDFSPYALPISDTPTHYFPTAGSDPFQIETWSAILNALDALYSACVDGEEKGWATVGEGIVVAYWGRASLMDQDYGIRAAEDLRRVS